MKRNCAENCRQSPVTLATPFSLHSISIAAIQTLFSGDNILSVDDVVVQCSELGVSGIGVHEKNG